MATTEHPLVLLAKNLIQPQDVRVGGELRPEAANRVISMVQKDPFLSKITVERMRRLKKDVQVFDIMPRQLRRIPQGQEPQDTPNPDNVTPNVNEYGCTLHALDMQLFPTLSLDFLRDNADNPNLLSEINGSFNTTFQNDLTDLAVNGTEEAAAVLTQTDFTKLNKGWRQIALDSSQAKKTTIAPMTDGWIDTLAKVRKESDYRFRNNCVFVMNPDDADAYSIEIGKHVTGAAVIANQNGQGFLNQKIEACQFMPPGHLLYTPLRNLIMGLHTLIRRDSAWHVRRRELEFTYDMAADFEIYIKQAVVYATP